MPTNDDWHGRGGSPADAAIDQALRDFMRRDPAPGFRRRVLARLEAAPAPRRMIPLWAHAPLGAAAGVLAMMLVLTPGTPPMDTAPPPAAVAPSVAAQSGARVPPTAPTASAAEAPAAPAGARAASRRAVQSPRRERLADTPRTDTVFGPADGRVRAAGLQAPEPATETGAPDPGLTPIAIAPIEIPPLIVEPLADRAAATTRGIK